MTSHAPITLGRTMRVVETPGFIFTETAHEAETDLPAHAHEHAALSIVFRGARTHRFGSRSFECEEGSFLLVPPGAMHTSRFRGPSTGLMIELRANTAGDEPCAGRLRRHRVNALRSELAAAAPSPHILESFALDLLTSTPPEWLLHTRNSLREVRSANLDALAAAAGVHRTHLTRAFRHHFGSSVGEYVRTMRVQRAAQLLDETALPLAEIAMQCGFADQSHLTRAFRATFGTTPGERRADASRVQDAARAPHLS